jgi:hypothetical protein
MLAHEVDVREVGAGQLGWAVTESVRTAGGKRLVPKGGIIDEAALAGWSDVPDGTLHLIEIESGDLHEDVAGRRVAAAVIGAGVDVEGPFHSRYNLKSRQRGLLLVDEQRVHAVNAVGAMSLFTRYSHEAVGAGKTVAGVKATPIVVPAAEVEVIEELARAGDRPIVDVLPFVPMRAAVIATEALHPRLRASFEQRVRDKLDWYGSELLGVEFVEAGAGAVASAFRSGIERDADLFMAAGGNTLDPLDPILLALSEIGAEMVHFGAPADPGSMFWVARAGERPIFNLASCSMYSEATVIDLMLPLALAGLPITAADVARLGYGGLLEDDLTFRFPDYEAE